MHYCKTVKKAYKSFAARSLALIRSGFNIADELINANLNSILLDLIKRRAVDQSAARWAMRTKVTMISAEKRETV